MDRRDLVLDIPAATFIKIAVFALAVCIIIVIAPLMLLMSVAALLAVVLAAANKWLEKKGVRHGLAWTFTSGILFAVFIAFLVVVVPNVAAELQALIKDAPRISQRIIYAAPATAPYVDAIVAEVQRPPHAPTARQVLLQGMAAGWYAIEGITTILLVLVLAVYFAVEGKRALLWLFSFAPEPQRRKLHLTVTEIHPVMLAYMRGQLITSTLSAIAAAAVLIPLGVPAAVPLVVLAFIGDFVPVIGFIASIVPAVLLALLVGPPEAVIVAAVYIGYQSLENYVISPKVYGAAMRLSTLTVLLAILVGGTLMGPIGAIIMLPIAAAYSAIERIWLEKHLPEDTVERHEAIESA